MKNKLPVLIAIVTIVIGMSFYISTFYKGSTDVSKTIEKTEEKEQTDTVPNFTAGEEEEEVGSEVKTEFPLDMSEAAIQDAIHAMSHSKVYAEEKWSHLEPTKERIDRLLVVVEKNENVLTNSDLYIRILKRWKAGDFSNAVSDHNDVWSLKGGNVGEATRLLTLKEEAEYRAAHFK